MRTETTTFTGPFAKSIQKYLEEKQTVGYKIESYVYSLKSFDTFSNEYDIKFDFLTKELINDWLKLRPDEKKSNQASRANIIRGFCKYMNLFDNKSYILPDGIYSCNDKYDAYIYSEKEIRMIFKQIDYLAKTQPNKQKKNFSNQIIFRLLYMCGMRISEVLNIRLCDFNQEEKIIIIKHAKKDKDRIIPINNEINHLIVNYINTFHIFSDSNDYLFKNKNNSPYTRFTIYERFRTILAQCNIDHNENGPNLHSFRHTFAVHCLKKWVLEGKDLMVYLPVLKTFLGHDSFRETAYYLKLTSDVYPNITNMVETKFNNLIPRLEEVL